MTKLVQTLSMLAADRRGATAIEYGLIAAGIAIAIVTILGTVGGDLNNLFNDISSGLQTTSE